MEDNQDEDDEWVVTPPEFWFQPVIVFTPVRWTPRPALTNIWPVVWKSTLSQPFSGWNTRNYTTAELPFYDEGRQNCCCTILVCELWGWRLSDMYVYIYIYMYKMAFDLIRCSLDPEHHQLISLTHNFPSLNNQSQSEPETFTPVYRTSLFIVGIWASSSILKHAICLALGGLSWKMMGGPGILPHA